MLARNVIGRISEVALTQVDSNTYELKPPAGHVYKVLHVFGRITCDGTIGFRRVRIQIRRNGKIVLNTRGFAQYAENQSGGFSAFNGADLSRPNELTPSYIAMPPEVWLDDQTTLYVKKDPLGPGDTLTNLTALVIMMEA